MHGSHSLSLFHMHRGTDLLFKEVLRSFAVMTKQRKKVSGHVKLKLSCPNITEMIRQDHLTERQMDEINLFFWWIIDKKEKKKKEKSKLKFKLKRVSF